ncbi:SO2930 family diheme c-type cytochrome [Shewanella sp. GXUN23E]|uniref:SO2930 family diheme c-type cytochrome n=1 Tax=Shewanella sp. GXUN23E TaxID=3422498 RepID=UPI003D7D06BF
MTFNKLCPLLLTVFLAACGGGGESTAATPTPVTPTPTPPPTSSVCDAGNGDVNWQALAKADCDDLAQYGLFVNELDPTNNPNSPGIFYTLSTELFSNYASKYRFIFIPAGQTISYIDQQTLTFPTGTVLVKTFALPADTQVKEPQNETLIETRLLIKRDAGWTTLPYRWQAGKATLAIAGGRQSHTMNHQGDSLTFDYPIPSRAECKVCHQQTDSTGQSTIVPIGLKPWLLNTSLNGDNQLLTWQAQGLLTNLPAINTIALSGSPDNQQVSLQARAKGYLAINCGHCHSDSGYASVSGLRLGYFVDHTGFSYGICKQPPGWDGGPRGLDYDIVPGSAEHSILVYRQQLSEPKDRMPPLGRALTHTEGVELVSQWINGLSPTLGNCY